MYEAARIELPHQVIDWREVSGGTRSAPKVCPNGPFQFGGERAAHRYLHSFFRERASAYSRCRRFLRRPLPY